MDIRRTFLSPQWKCKKRCTVTNTEAHPGKIVPNVIERMETVHSKTHGWQMFTQVFTLDKCRIFYLFSLTNQRTKENAVCWEKIRHDVKMGWNGCLNRSGLNKVNVIFQITYSNVCMWMNSFVFWFKCHWSLFLRLQMIVRRNLFKQGLRVQYTTSHYVKQCRTSSRTEICHQTT